MLPFFVFMSHSRVFQRLKGCSIIFRRNFRTKYWYLFYNMPLESIQTYFSHNTYAIRKKNTHLLHAFEELDIELNYLYNCGSSISKIQPCSNPLKLLSNSIGLIWFGFFQAKLCLISHNDPILDWFSRDNLYDFPRVTISSFGSEIDI